ncbi:hypothetical protein BKA67DRAFT_595889 [Truncatella angustata]|uniref:Uncharacterized protein n=1 Tax=Truncatella angustata TaxID=152316 RepID=A0A9P8U8Z4_9PEZI|nr:uncharacterized protein BKA67DRAFT_595889 [Truncatella angustata]KAH6645724.1 hypothetical protein BKA67DRAFT_595889 [Truncatella angustata]
MYPGSAFRLHPPSARLENIADWYPYYQSCQNHFLAIAQHTNHVQILAASINIRLPLQILQLSNARDILTIYIRRLVATGLDTYSILNLFFGHDWPMGIGHIHEIERRHYLLAAKSASWLEVKSYYDMGDGQSIPYLRPLQNVTEEEIVAAESAWSAWLAMQDWMLGPRSPWAKDAMAAGEVYSPGC